MPIVIGAIAPHGIRTIPLLSDTADGAPGTRQALLEMGRRFTTADLDVLCVCGPHGIRVNGFVSLSDTARGAGTAYWRGKTVELNVRMDRDLSEHIAERARKRGVPVAQVGFGGTNPSQSVLQLDWSVIVPAWFAGYQTNMPGMGHPLADRPADIDKHGGPELIVANPSRMLPREANIEFGKAVAEAAAASSKRVGFIASCDWSHTHVDSHRFRAHPAAKDVDARVVEYIKSDDLTGLMDIGDSDAQNAAIDGLWQALMLEGVKQVTPMKVDFLSYEVAEYFGMIVATYHP